MIADLDRSILNFLTVSSNNICSVKAVDPQNKKKRKNNKMEKWAYFAIRQTS